MMAPRYLAVDTYTDNIFDWVPSPPTPACPTYPKTCAWKSRSGMHVPRNVHSGLWRLLVLNHGWYQKIYLREDETRRVENRSDREKPQASATHAYQRVNSQLIVTISVNHHVDLLMTVEKTNFPFVAICGESNPLDRTCVSPSRRREFQSHRVRRSVACKMILMDHIWIGVVPRYLSRSTFECRAMQN